MLFKIKSFEIIYRSNAFKIEQKSSKYNFELQAKL